MRPVQRHPLAMLVRLALAGRERRDAGRGRGHVVAGAVGSESVLVVGGGEPWPASGHPDPQDPLRTHICQLKSNCHNIHYRN